MLRMDYKITKEQERKKEKMRGILLMILWLLELFSKLRPNLPIYRQGRKALEYVTIRECIEYLWNV